MYSRYLTDSAGAPIPEYREETRRDAPSHRSKDLFGEVTGGVGELLGGLLKHFSLEKLDSGDILLALIMLFLVLEGDDLEMVITLGLMLLMGLGEDHPVPDRQAGSFPPPSGRRG